MSDKRSSNSTDEELSVVETQPTRRDFIILTSTAVTIVGAALATWPFIDSMNPAANVLALASVDVDISSVQPGQSIMIKWRGKPVVIRRRTQKEIDDANNVDVSSLRDPQNDGIRVKKGHEEWLIMIATCTHLGCVPLGQQGDYGGWFCPCHGSHYDTSGRIRKGPAPANLVIPDYEFVNDKIVRIG